MRYDKNKEKIIQKFGNGLLGIRILSRNHPDNIWGKPCIKLNNDDKNMYLLKSIPAMKKAIKMIEGD